jgi:ATP-binding cassette subfamily C protein
LTELEQAVASCRRAMITIFALSGITTILILALPFYMTQVYTRVLPSRSVETLAALSALALIAFMLYGIFDAIRQALSVRVAARYEALLSGPLVCAQFTNDKRSATAGVELMQDIRQVRGFIASRALAAISEAPFIPLFMIILFMVDVSLGLVICVGMGLMLLLAVLQQNAMARAIEAEGQSGREASRVLQAHLDQIETVRVLGLQKVALRLWGESNAAALTSFVKIQSLAATYGGVSKFLRYSLQAGILGAGALLAIEGQVSSIVVFACMMIGGRALAPMDGLVGSWGAMIGAWQAHVRIRDALVGFRIDDEKTSLPKPEGHVIVENLVYGVAGQKEPIIKRLSFSLPAGQALGIIGPSGAGKSTLLRLLAGAIEPTSGNVRLDSADLRNWNRVQLGQHVGYVPQSVDFFPGTIAENIARFQHARDDGEVVGAAQQAGVHEMIMKMPRGYDTVLGRGAFTPSGGQKQLLALARAFYREPNLLFLDEPNASLDQEGDHLLHQAIRRARERGATVIIVTQRPVLLQVVDRVLVMKDGAIENYGPREKILPKVVRPSAVAQPGAKANLSGEPRLGLAEVAGGPPVLTDERASK